MSIGKASSLKYLEPVSRGPNTEGDSQGFNDTYLAALHKQREAQRSVGSDAAEPFQQTLPYEIYLKIFSYLTPEDVCRAMRVCKVGGLIYTLFPLKPTLNPNSRCGTIWQWTVSCGTRCTSKSGPLALVWRPNLTTPRPL